MKLLVIEDDKRIAHALEQGLTEDGHSVFISHRGYEAVDLITSQHFDVVVLDIMLPGTDGFTVLKRTRQAKCDVPILVLTAKDAVPDMVRGLDLGADDYLTKPFQLAVLLASVRAVGRRRHIPLLDQITVDDLVLDRSCKIARRGDTEIALTRKEFALVDLLMRRAQQVVSRTELITAGWGYDAEVSDNNIDYFMHSLRSKINLKGAPTLLRTVRAQGYTLGLPR
jgi:two-component system copper resistance phosphate regulon response regulator CusR